MTTSAPPKQQLSGTIERITFQNQETGFLIAHIKPTKELQTICIVGSMPTVHVGASVSCTGQWKQHPTYGSQFAVETYELQAPADLEAIEKYLQSQLVHGIGPVYAKKIVAHFREQTFDILDKEPERLKEIQGLGSKRILALTEAWQKQKSIRDVMLFLQQQGVTPAYAQKIYRQYGEQTIPKMQENPYLLAHEIIGIGFLLADKIASRMGIEKESPARIRAGIQFRLEEKAQEGHVCYPFQIFLEETSLQLEVEKALIREEAEQLRKEEAVVVYPLRVGTSEEPHIWTAPLFLAEQGIAKEMMRLLKSPPSTRKIDPHKALGWVQKQLGIAFAKEQESAVLQAFQQKVQIITGGPGTGKSTITHAILAISEQLTSKIILAAPTGRAAKRLSEITGHKASTIHSLLEYDFSRQRFKKNRHDPLDADLLIIDEASMIDTYLLYSLLKAVSSHARLILVGDIFQLPSVGPGNVLKDLIASHLVPVTQLKEIFRQAAGSQIVTNAHRINQGIFPEIQNKEESDFYFLKAEDPHEAVDLIRQLVSIRLPVRYSFDPLQDIQVLTPMRKGLLGTQNLNAALQQTLNPKASSHLQRFYPGDKVMQLRNNYTKEVWNGDIGIVQEFDASQQELLVQINDRLLSFSPSEWEDLTLAYAVSVHKYQGSECPCIILPIHTTHFKLLHRNLLYTAVTRGKRLVILVGMAKAVAIAVHNDEVKNRYTGLQQALARVS